MDYLPLDRKEDIKSHKYLRVMNQFTQQVNLLCIYWVYYGSLK